LFVHAGQKKILGCSNDRCGWTSTVLVPQLSSHKETELLAKAFIRKLITEKSMCSLNLEFTGHYLCPHCCTRFLQSLGQVTAAEFSRMFHLSPSVRLDEIITQLNRIISPIPPIQLEANDTIIRWHDHPFTPPKIAPNSRPRKIEIGHTAEDPIPPVLPSPPQTESTPHKSLLPLSVHRDGSVAPSPLSVNSGISWTQIILDEMKQFMTELVHRQPVSTPSESPPSRLAIDRTGVIRAAWKMITPTPYYHVQLTLENPVPRSLYDVQFLFENRTKIEIFPYPALSKLPKGQTILDFFIISTQHPRPKITFRLLYSDQEEILAQELPPLEPALVVSFPQLSEEDIPIYTKRLDADYLIIPLTDTRVSLSKELLIPLLENLQLRYIDTPNGSPQELWFGPHDRTVGPPVLVRVELKPTQLKITGYRVTKEAVPVSSDGSGEQNIFRSPTICTWPQQDVGCY
jgi:hypothetical protein